MSKRLLFLTLVVACILACWVAAAAAKVLLVTDLRVATHEPKVGEPVRVVLRLDPASGLRGPVPALVHGEVAVVPARRTDQQGWPLRGVRGEVVALSDRGGGEYRGSFEVRRAGSYVVFSESSAVAHALRSEHVVNVPADLPAPIKILVTK